MAIEHLPSPSRSSCISAMRLPAVLAISLTLLIAPNCGGSSSSDDSDSEGKGLYTQTSGTVIESGKTYSTSDTDTSAVYVLNTGTNYTLSDGIIITSGDSSSADDSSFYGLNAAVLATNGAIVNLTNCTITTSGLGANGAFAYGGTVNLDGVTIVCTGRLGHGVDATGNGTLTLKNVNATTSGANSSVIATDRGSGTITVTGGTFKASGTDSAGIYSTGDITVSDATISSTNGEAAVVEGENSVSVTGNSTLSAGSSERGVMILQSGSGDANGTTGSFTMTGGSLTSTSASAPMFEVVTNATGNITLNGISTLSIASGILMKVDYNTRWSTKGATGNLIANGQTMTGSVSADSYSIAKISLTNSSSWTGAMDTANTAKAASVTIDGTSVWNLDADSNVDTLTVSTGAKIHKNGHNLNVTTTVGSGATID